MRIPTPVPIDDRKPIVLHEHHRFHDRLLRHLLDHRRPHQAPQAPRRNRPRPGKPNAQPLRRPLQRPPAHTHRRPRRPHLSRLMPRMIRKDRQDDLRGIRTTGRIANVSRAADDRIRRRRFTLIRPSQARRRAYRSSQRMPRVIRQRHSVVRRHVVIPPAHQATRASHQPARHQTPTARMAKRSHRTDHPQHPGHHTPTEQSGTRAAHPSGSASAPRKSWSLPPTTRRRGRAG